MASQKAVRKVLLVAGGLCLFGAFLPYYSKTIQPVAGVPDVSVDLPVVGEQTLPKETTRTVTRIGLPFSPLFTYESRFDYSEAPKSIKIKPEDGKVAAGLGSIAVQGPGQAEVTTFNFNYDLNSHLHITSWSTALALLGLVLLVAAWWRVARKPTLAVEPIATGERAG
jgi:hypothetical protein